MHHEVKRHIEYKSMSDCTRATGWHTEYTSLSDGLCAHRMLLRYPGAKKSIRKHAIRSALREDLVCYTHGLRHVRDRMDLPYLPSLLPSKHDLGGGHLSQHKYHRFGGHASCPPGASALSYPGQRHDFLLFACVMLVHWEAVQPTVMWDHAFVAACQAYHHCRPRAVASVSCDSKCL